MRGGILAHAKHVVIEHETPCATLRLRKLTNGKQSMHERFEGRARPRLRVVPPVVDEDVEHIERLDVMPPQMRHEDRITRLELRVLRMLASLGKARISIEVRRF